MRTSFAIVFLLPSIAFAQPTAAQKKETVNWVTDLQDPNGGFYPNPQDPNTDAAPRPSLRATSSAARVLKYLGADVPNKDKHAAFVLKCYDPKTGGFAEPGGKPDVVLTSIGVMAAAEFGIPHEKYAKAMDYLKENAKTFEDVRIGAAGVEAWGVKDCPFKLDSWFEIAATYGRDTFKGAPGAEQAREAGSLLAFNLRLKPDEKLEPGNQAAVAAPLLTGQRADGGWGKKGEKASDIETTYRVMRALMLLKEKPKDVKELRAFINAHRNKDGGFATKPGDKSSMGGVYYCTVISKWLDEMDAAKK
ncbi:Prenyltransferase and squalene oxidase repeat protein [Gemmata sp. SH-PL17]|uniref:prenyltransferase/squalene oxidase repeat-containing protein n=1 Tax=Gemmata sp. SH-PL17 TaxID=1630693 RepID=UPI00078BABA9|nr:prenyltransferase/squalene oxidase repeat-containing protein [Gemmata sp. SH-PL17]AMV29196.1 Prenyltransferase and squalene oxidase repeat protein [Gemmata sp. SH-PL17]